QPGGAAERALPGELRGFAGPTDGRLAPAECRAVHEGQRWQEDRAVAASARLHLGRAQPSVSFWGGLARKRSFVGMREVWRLVLGQAATLLEPFLRPLPELTDFFPCPHGAYEGCPRRVWAAEPEQILALCGNAPTECETVRLDRDDLVLYELDPE